MKKNSFILIIILILITISLYPQDNMVKKNTEELKKEKIDISEFSKETPISMVNFFMALSFVIGLIFLSTYFLKKLTGIKSSGLRGQAVKISIISNLPLGDKKFLLIVEIQKKHYFVGVTPSSINYMTELNIDMSNVPSDEERGEFKGILEKAKEMLSGNKK